MATAQEKIIDSYIRHQVNLLRYSASVSNLQRSALATTETDLRRALLELLSEAPGRSLTGQRGREWVRELEELVRGIRTPAWSAIMKSTVDEMREFIRGESAGAAFVIEGAIPTGFSMVMPSAQQLLSIVNSQPFDGDTLKGWVNRTAAADVSRIVKAAKVGIVQGQPPTEIARHIAGTSKQVGNRAVMRKSFRDIESVLLTVTNGLQQQAKQALYEANADIIKEEIFLATLDSGTTFVCAGNDWKTFIRGKGPIPPLHMRCRSLRVPRLNADALHKRGFDSSYEKLLANEYASANKLPVINTRSGLPYGHKVKFDTFSRGRVRELVGQVPAETPFDSFLSRQSAAYQQNYLGPARWEMYKKGGIKMENFTNDQGAVLTLSELRGNGYHVP